MAKKPKKKKPPKKPRARTLRRAQERRLRKVVADRIALAKVEAGGCAERPIEVGSASIVETRALSLGCPVCAGALRLSAHDARTVEGVSLRRVQARCVECETEREVWMRIVVCLAN